MLDILTPITAFSRRNNLKSVSGELLDLIHSNLRLCEQKKDLRMVKVQYY